MQSKYGINKDEVQDHLQLNYMITAYNEISLVYVEIHLIFNVLQSLTECLLVSLLKELLLQSTIARTSFEKKFFDSVVSSFHACFGRYYCHLEQTTQGNTFPLT